MTAPLAPRARGAARRRLHAWVLYARALLHEFRYSLATVAVALLGGAVALARSSPSELHGHPRPVEALFAAFALLIGQPMYALPPELGARIVYFLFPLLGLLVGAEVVVRLSLLLFSRQRDEKEWNRVLAQTYRDHVVLCGLGAVGSRVLERLVAYGLDVVALERDSACRHLPRAKALDVPVLQLDARDESALEQAGVERARAIVVATNDDLANLEVALDARRLNPRIRVVMRMFDQGIARKVGETFALDVPFSSSALAAPVVAAHVIGEGIVGSVEWEGRVLIAAEVEVAVGSALAGRTVAQVEERWGAVVLGRRAAGAAPGQAGLRPAAITVLGPGDRLLVQAPIETVRGLSDRAGAAAGPRSPR